MPRKGFKIAFIRDALENLSPSLDGGRASRCPHHHKGLGKKLAVQCRRVLHHYVSETCTKPGGILHRLKAVGVNGRARNRDFDKCNVQFARLGLYFIEVRTRWRWSPVRVAGAGPAVGSSNAALSRTERVTACSTTNPPMISPRSGASVMRARVGFSPKTPQHEAGMRIDPPPSFACAIGTMPAATAAQAPPLEPPAVRVVFHGFRVGPKSRGSVVASRPNSGVLVFPTMIRPARFSLQINSLSWFGI